MSSSSLPTEPGDLGWSDPPLVVVLADGGANLSWLV